MMYDVHSYLFTGRPYYWLNNIAYPLLVLVLLKHQDTVELYA
jgi:hypothetical protein